MPKKILGFFLFFLLFPIPKSACAQTTYYFSPVFEKTDGVVTKYYPLPGGTTVMRRRTDLSYLHTDHLASTRLVTSEQGTVVGQLDYFPYGSPGLTRSTGSAGLTDRLYTSQILDSSTDLYFYNARQYNPRTAAFISADSAQGPNRYAYVAGNPISRNDPSGNWENPYSGEEPEYWKNLYQNYQTVLREEKGAKFSPNETKKILQILNKLPPELYENLTVLKANSKHMKLDIADDSDILRKIDNFIFNLMGASPGYADIGLIEFNSMASNPIWNILHGFNFEQIFVHELAHANLDLWGEEWIDYTDEQGKVLGSALVSKLQEEFEALAGWQFSPITGTKENSGRFSREEPGELFANMATYYYKNPKNFENFYGSELSNFFSRYYSNKPEKK